MLRTVLAPNPSPMTLDGTRTYLVGSERPAVIDPGPDDPSHVEALLGALGGRRPVAILLTHAHADHAAAAPALAARTGAPVMIAEGADHLPFDRGLVSRWLQRDRIETDAGVLSCIITPGHAVEHACFLWTGGGGEHEGALFAGDMFVGGADTTLVAPPEGDLTDYLWSLVEIERLGPTIIYPAHGPPLTDPPEALRRYQAHRESRILQVVDALAAGPASPGEMLDRVYGPDLHPELRTAAAGSLEAILAHLDWEGRTHPLPDGRHALR